MARLDRPYPSVTTWVAARLWVHGGSHRVSVQLLMPALGLEHHPYCPVFRRRSPMDLHAYSSRRRSVWRVFSTEDHAISALRSTIMRSSASPTVASIGMCSSSFFAMRVSIPTVLNRLVWLVAALTSIVPPGTPFEYRPISSSNTLALRRVSFSQSLPA